jgi:hypothetical protein
VFVGHRASKILQPAVVQKVAAVAFGVLGAFLIVTERVPV